MNEQNTPDESKAAVGQSALNVELGAALNRRNKMACSYEGLIEIPLEDFWQFVEKYMPKTSGELVYGIPKVDKGAGTLNIAFAVGDETHPKDWSSKPDAVKEWESA